jgi:hypothetical protein
MNRSTHPAGTERQEREGNEHPRAAVEPACRCAEVDGHWSRCVSRPPAFQRSDGWWPRHKAVTKRWHLSMDVDDDTCCLGCQLFVFVGHRPGIGNEQSRCMEQCVPRLSSSDPDSSSHQRRVVGTVANERLRMITGLYGCEVAHTDSRVLAYCRGRRGLGAGRPEVIVSEPCCRPPPILC